MGYKLNDSASFTPFCVKVSAKNGKVILGEHLVDGIKNGAFLEINANTNSHEYCFYENDQRVGPIFKRQGAGFEYSFSDGVYSAIGFRIKYDDGNFYIGRYDASGRFTGEAIKIYENGKISFIASGQFGNVSKEVPTNIKFAKINNKKFDYDIKGIAFRSSNPHLIPVHYEGKHPVAITMYGAMYAEYYNPELRFLSESYSKLQEQLRKLNHEYKTGYGYYPYKSGAVRLGHIKNMDGVAVFDGPCIYRKNNQYQLGMVGVESKKNDINLLCDVKNNKYEIARFLGNDYFGFSILMTANGIEMSYKFNNERSDKLYIDYTLNMIMHYQDGRVVSLPYSLEYNFEDVKENLVVEDKESLKEELNAPKKEPKLSRKEERELQKKKEYRKALIMQEMRKKPWMTFASVAKIVDEQLKNNKGKIPSNSRAKTTPTKKKNGARSFGIKDFLLILATPFIYIGKGFKVMFGWLKELRISPMILIFLLLGITGFYIYIGQTNQITKLTFGIDVGDGAEWGQWLLNNYDFKLANLIIKLFKEIASIGGNSPNLLGILVRIILYVPTGVIFLLCGAADLVVYVLIALIFWFVIGLIFNILFQFLMYIGIPLFVPIFTWIVTAKLDEEKAAPAITAILSSIGTIYYIILFVMTVISNS